MGNHATFIVLGLSTVFYFVVSLVSDRFGRKVAFLVSTATGILGAVISLATVSWGAIVAGLFTQITGNDGCD